MRGRSPTSSLVPVVAALVIGGLLAVRLDAVLEAEESAEEEEEDAEEVEGHVLAMCGG